MAGTAWSSRHNAPLLELMNWSAGMNVLVHWKVETSVYDPWVWKSPSPLTLNLRGQSHFQAEQGETSHCHVQRYSVCNAHSSRRKKDNHKSLMTPMCRPSNRPPSIVVERSIVFSGRKEQQ
jgi:hypothetical protein